MLATIKLYVIVFGAAAIGFFWGGYDYGSAKSTKACQQGIAALQSAVDKANREALELENRQKQAYRVALDVRNKQYDEISTELEYKLMDIDRLKSESTDSCVSAKIPLGFK